LEYICLCDSWKTGEQITRANQNSGAYWKMTKTEFDKNKVVNKNYSGKQINTVGAKNYSGKQINTVGAKRTMSTRWSIIQQAVNLFHGYHINIEQRSENGMNADNMVSLGRPYCVCYLDRLH
jgi:hypothetical protein